MLRDAISDQLNSAVGGVVDTIMRGIWAASVWLLRTVFGLIDSFTTINFISVDGEVDPGSPIGTIWPLMRWISLAIATGLFFLQLTMTMLRGGRGLFRLVTGPLAYAVAVGMTAGGIGLLFAAGDGLAAIMLEQGLRADGFVGVLDSEAAAKVFIPSPPLDADPVGVESAATLASSLDATARSVVLGLVAIFAIVPAGMGFLLENLFRIVAFLVLVASSPITAAGLLTDATAAWFWRGVRWAVTAAVLKPALVLVLIIGVNTLSGPTGLAALLAGGGTLLVALFCPFALYRLLAFVDPGTNAGAAVRGQLSMSRSSSSRSSDTGGNAADGAGGEGGTEAAHAARFDAAGTGAGTGGGAGAGGAGAGGTGAGGAGAGAAAGGAVAGIGAAVVAAGHFASQYANQTMDASGIGHPHGGRGGPPAAARRGGGAGTAGHRGGAGGGDGGDGDGGDAGGSPAVAWPDYGEDFPPDPGWDYDEPGGYDSGGYDSGGYDPGPDYGDPGTGSGDGGYGWTADDAAVQSGRGPGSGASSA